MKKILAKIGLMIIISILMTSVVQAAETNTSSQTDNLSPIDNLSPGYNLRPVNAPFNLTGTEFSKDNGANGTIIVLQILTGGLLYFAAPVAIIFIVMAGIQMMIGGAESEKLEQAKKHLTWSVIGLTLIIFSYSIVRAALTFIFQAAANGTPTA